MNLKVFLVVIFATLSHAKVALYELALSDENIFSACPDTAPGTLDIHGFFDLSECLTTLEEDGIIISGNTTFIWDIQPQDRIKMVVKLLYFDRGTWSPTFFSVIAHDLCKSMYDSRQPWYPFWTGHVKNVEDVMDKCVNPGTKLIYETYNMSPTFNMKTIREGLYKVHYNLHAFDSDGTERPTNICFDVVGNLLKKSGV
ncbi:hypothetical protein KR059_001526 [Drosophila kikkawai]|nr:hypothetical protein KR059_001526 [Drosophila kikkawai]